MSVNRVVSLAAAVVISAIQVAALSSPLSHGQSVSATAAVSTADDGSDGALPVIVVTAHSGSRLSGVLSMHCKSAHRSSGTNTVF